MLEDWAGLDESYEISEVCEKIAVDLGSTIEELMDLGVLDYREIMEIWMDKSNDDSEDGEE